ncbi:MAG: hypothetical protein ACW99U_21270, partial [Candidatus Thorarchaeota archaeon]
MYYRLLAFILMPLLLMVCAGCSEDETEDCWDVIRIKDGRCSSLNSVHGCCDNTIYAVGYGHYDNGVLYSFYDPGWMKVDVSSPQELLDVWVEAESQIHTVSKSSLYHFDGINWTELLTAENSDTKFGDVWSYEGGELFLSGRRYSHPDERDLGLVLYYNGTDWSETTIVDTEGVSDVWGTSEQSVYTTGRGLFHYNGIEWLEIWTNYDRSYGSVWGSSDDDIYLTGTPSMHYDGNDWSEVDVPTRERMLVRVWGRSREDVYAISY